MATSFDYDYVIIGSGFGGSVSALRLAEKGYKVVVIEKGKWFSKAEDFPKTNWNLKKWLWLPKLGWNGILKLTFYRHVAVLSGVGVGGGSLVYANTLPIPKSPFFKTGQWNNLCDWETELTPFYALAKKMLGAEKHPYTSKSEKVMQQLASELGEPQSFEKTDVAIYFGKHGVTKPDPYFDGKGPDRTGCIQCGGCMLGCRYNAKNTLDKNYLHLAQQLGGIIKAEKEVYDVVPLSENGDDGYEIYFKDSLSYFPKKEKITAKGVVFSGGVLGTLNLLLKLQSTSLPNLSQTLGKGVRTNSESLIGVTTFDRDVSFSDGIAIGSIVHIDENRHIEPVKYSAGSGFWRVLMAPMIQGNSLINRLAKMLLAVLKQPAAYLKTFFVDDWSKRTQILLYMESIESTLKMQRSKWGFLITKLDKGPAPTAFNPIAQTLAKKVEVIINGKAMVVNTEALLGIPTTAHILGGACMGKDANEGVINQNNEVYNYKNMLICDGSMISANIGVNPSLTITALTERAMSKIKKETNSTI
nr:GMC oxidoreductase [uncultured Flavobacterium sp.]